MNRSRRIVVGLIGFVLILASFVVLWNGMLVQSGLGEFATTWDRRLQGSVELGHYRTINGDVPPPGETAFNQDLWHFAGAKSIQTQVFSQTVTLVSGILLLLIVLVPSRSKIVPGAA
jgi:hypothetical protein